MRRRCVVELGRVFPASTQLLITDGSVKSPSIARTELRHPGRAPFKVEAGETQRENNWPSDCNDINDTIRAGLWFPLWQKQVVIGDTGGLH